MLFALRFFFDPLSADGEIFRVASYNVENLFDLDYTGFEYDAYVPYSNFGWDTRMAGIKFTNIAQVVKDLDADIVTLQEVESLRALVLLRDKLKGFGVYYPFYEIAEIEQKNVSCAVMSKFEIVQKDNISVKKGAGRKILKIVIDVHGNLFTLFVNHWKSKSGPESRRISYAKVLRKEIDKLPADVDYILVGDFNSNYDEFKTFAGNARLNDTGGVTGINHILKTIDGKVPVNQDKLQNGSCHGCLYNLWMELKPENRWSYIFSGKKESLDNIIAPMALFDNKGISYVNNSFKRFSPEYLFNGKRVFRWQRAKRGRGRHLGEGYSDHLPVFADFSTR